MKHDAPSIENIEFSREEIKILRDAVGYAKSVMETYPALKKDYYPELEKMRKRLLLIWFEQAKREGLIKNMIEGALREDMPLSDYLEKNLDKLTSV